MKQRAKVTRTSQKLVERDALVTFYQTCVYTQTYPVKPFVEYDDKALRYYDAAMFTSTLDTHATTSSIPPQALAHATTLSNPSRLYNQGCGTMLDHIVLGRISDNVYISPFESIPPSSPSVVEIIRQDSENHHNHHSTTHPHVSSSISSIPLPQPTVATTTTTTTTATTTTTTATTTSISSNNSTNDSPSPNSEPETNKTISPAEHFQRLITQSMLHPSPATSRQPADIPTRAQAREFLTATAENKILFTEQSLGFLQQFVKQFITSWVRALYQRSTQISLPGIVPIASGVNESTLIHPSNSFLRHLLRSHPLFRHNRSLILASFNNSGNNRR